MNIILEVLPAPFGYHSWRNRQKNAEVIPKWHEWKPQSFPLGRNPDTLRNLDLLYVTQAEQQVTKKPSTYIFHQKIFWKSTQPNGPPLKSLQVTKGKQPELSTCCKYTQFLFWATVTMNTTYLVTK